MTDRNIHVGIAFNDYEPKVHQHKERISEESVKQVAEEVFAAITSIGYSATTLPLRVSLMNFLTRMKELNVDVLINLCEGFSGCPQLEANVAAVFELLGMAFTGNNSRALGLCQDKFKTKSILRSVGLPTAPCRLVTSPDQAIDLDFPVIVKPNSEDASLGVYSDSVVYDQQNLSKQINKIISGYNQFALVEKYIEGREFNVAILDSDSQEALPVSEIDFSRMPDTLPHICGYEAKWFEDHILYNSTPPVCPAKIDDSLRNEVQRMALAAFQAMGCRDYARVDFRMDNGGQFFILEVNPNPDISSTAGYARALAASGIDYKLFWNRLINNALRRNNHRDSSNGKNR